MRFAATGAAVLATMALAVACGGDDDDEADEATTAAAPAATSAAEEPATSEAATSEAATSEPAESAPAETTAAETTAEAAGTGLDPSVCEGKSLSFIGLAGEEGEKELKQWRDDLGMSLAVNNMADWGQLIGAIKVGQPHDLATIPYWQAEVMIDAGIFKPIDTTKLANWSKLFPAFQENEVLRGDDGQVYGVPIAWGDGPFVYDPERVPNPPTSIMDLTKPEWKGRISLFDDPASPFNQIAVAKGFEEPTLLTPEQLDEVAVEAKKILDNSAAFQTTYQDATDRLVAGDIDLAHGGWEAMLTWAEEKGKTLKYGFFGEGAGGWWDGLAIPSTAKEEECALAYIDQMIGAETNAAVAETLVSGTVNVDSVDMLGPAVAGVYDYTPLQDPSYGAQFISIKPPDEVPEGITTWEDWQAKWQEIKAG
jgi:spermidine/putrescine-binding protein